MTYQALRKRPIHSLDNLFEGLLSNKSILGNDQIVHKPHVNILSEDDQFVLELVAPGLQKSDFGLHVEDELLTIEVGVGSENKSYILKEFDFSNFKKTFKLPQQVDKENIKANYNQGILSVTLPLVKRESIIKNIEIQ